MQMAPGLVILFGSGEIAPSAQPVYNHVMRTLGEPIRVGILETPAGFQENSADVAGDVADYIERHLQNFQPDITVVPARKKGTDFSPDDPDIVVPLLTSNLIFIGPGSPTYAARQLRDTLTWQVVQARHRQGKAVVLASAATIASSAWSIPVYEIYKVGDDVHWKPGLDFWAPFGLSLVFVPHWDNSDGGAKHDTSRCFMGKARFAEMLELLPEDATIVGIDEHTALCLDLAADEVCGIIGRGGVTIIRGGQQSRYESGESFPFAALGDVSSPEIGEGIPDRVWQMIASAESDQASQDQPPESVLALAQGRQQARSSRDWSTADRLRDELLALGWVVRDTPDGPVLARGD